MSMPDPGPSRPNSPLKIADWFQGQSAPVTLGILPSPTKETTDPLDQLPSSTFSLQSLPNMAFFKSKPKTATTPGRFTNLLGKLNPSPCQPPSSSTPDLTSLDVESAQRDELLAAHAKIHRFEVQLENMVTRVAEQDKAMEELVNELARTKEAHRVELAKKQTVRLVSNESKQSGGEAKHRRTRKPRVSSGEVSDSGFESEGYDSGFSPGPGSPASPCSDFPSPSAGSAKKKTKKQQQAQEEPFEALKVTSGGSRLFLKDPGSWEGKEHHGRSEQRECSKCGERDRRGGVEEAWNVVDVLLEENQSLKGRIYGLEAAVDGCLEMMRGFQTS